MFFKKAKSEYEDGTELQNPGFLSDSQQKLSQQTRDYEQETRGPSVYTAGRWRRPDKGR